jgi:hypothetical protein
VSHILTGDGANTGLARIPATALQAIEKNLVSIQRKAIEDIVLPAFGRQFDAAGLHSRSGAARAAATRVGAKGNVCVIGEGGATVGVSYAVMPYLRWLQEGRGPVTPRNAKALKIPIGGGNFIFRKFARAAPARPFIFLTEHTREAYYGRIVREVMAFGAVPIK